MTGNNDDDDESNAIRRDELLSRNVVFTRLIHPAAYLFCSIRCLTDAGTRSRVATVLSPEKARKNVGSESYCSAAFRVHGKHN